MCVCAYEVFRIEVESLSAVHVYIKDSREGDARAVYLTCKKIFQSAAVLLSEIFFLFQKLFYTWDVNKITNIAHFYFFLYIIRIEIFSLSLYKYVRLKLKMFVQKMHLCVCFFLKHLFWTCVNTKKIHKSQKAYTWTRRDFGLGFFHVVY